MPMTVMIRFTGDVIVYETAKNWNFVFVTDDFHVVDLKHDQSSIVAGGLRKKGEKTRNLSLGLDPMPTTPPSADYSMILNMSAGYLHGVDADRKSNLAVEQASGQGREIIHLTIPLVGRLEGAAPIVDDYWIEDLSTGARSN